MLHEAGAPREQCPRPAARVFYCSAAPKLLTASSPSCPTCCSAIKNMTDSSVYFKSIDGLLKQAIAMKDRLNAAQGRR